MATKKGTPISKKTETLDKAAEATATNAGKTEPVKPDETAKAEARKQIPEKKAPAKKTAAKKTTAKKDIKVNTFVEYYGKQVGQKEIVASVKKAWTRSGKKVGDIKSMDLYIKPEEGAVYYVVNGTDTGAVAF